MCNTRIRYTLLHISFIIKDVINQLFIALLIILFIPTIDFLISSISVVLLSDVMAGQIFFNFNDFRAECLSHGGGKPSHRLVSDFLGSEVHPEDLSDALIAEIDAKNDEVKSASKSSF